jgi:hypothetical protein
MCLRGQASNGDAGAVAFARRSRMRRAIPLTLSFALLIGAIAEDALAQDFYFVLESPNAESGGLFGHRVSNAGDVDNDGCHDVIVGAWAENGGAAEAGRAYVFSGKGGLLHTLGSPNPDYDGRFGWSVSGAGDVDNDGYDDVIVGAADEDVGSVWNAGRAYVFSGQGGGLVYTLTSPILEDGADFGESVSLAGDVNNDMHGEVIVGAPYEDGGAYNSGRAYIFDGATGERLYTLESPNPESQGHFGFFVSSAGDVNNDGCHDVIVGAWAEDGDAVDAGRAYVFSGQGDLLHTLKSPNPDYDGRFGWSVSGAGDVDNDGYDDVIVGAADEDVASVWNAGRAYVFSGQGGGLLYTLTSPILEDGADFGESVSLAGDANNDMHGDVIVGAPYEDGGAINSGRAYIFNGATGERLYTLQSPNPEAYGHFGFFVSSAGDVNDEGFLNVISGAKGEAGGPGGAGRAYVYVSEMTLRGDLVEGSLQLYWTGNVNAMAYWVYGAGNYPFFEPGVSPPYEYRLAALPYWTTIWSSPNGIGDPLENWTYMIVVVDWGALEIARSNRVGEWDFGVNIP